MLTPQSEWFRDALLDLPPSCTRVTLGVKPNNHDDRRRGGRFSMYAEGDFGTVQVSWWTTSVAAHTQFEYPNERDVMDAFECDEPIRFRYGLTREG